MVFASACVIHVLRGGKIWVSTLIESALTLAVMSPHLYPGLPAHNAGIQAGDVLVEVEGTDVTHASGEQIINIIK